MRSKIIISLLFVLMLGLGNLALAAQGELSFPITIKIAGDDIDLQGNNDTVVAFTPTKFNEVAFSNNESGQPRSTLKNVGAATVDYTVRAEIASGAWQLGSETADNVSVLYAVFTRPLSFSNDGGEEKYRHDLTLADFGAEDIVTATAKVATDEVFAISSQEKAIKGYGVHPDSDRSLRYILKTPLSGDANEQTINVIIGAQISQ